MVEGAGVSNAVRKTVNPASAEPAPLMPVVWVSLPASALWAGDRRLEGDTYLTGGYIVKRQIETSGIEFTPMKEWADIWMPGRLKGITVDRAHGKPFFSASQVFDVRPTVRKWLAPSRTDDLARRYVEPGWILVTCSGRVGDSIMSYAPHKGAIITHDLLRVQAKRESERGYLYAFLRSRFGQAMLRSSQYGSNIKHLEPEHLEILPVPQGTSTLNASLNKAIEKVFQLRDEAHTLTLAAEAKFAEELGGVPSDSYDERGFVASSKEFFRKGRRLDGFHFNPAAEAVLAHVTKANRKVDRLEALTERVFGVGRFKHIYTKSGTPYLDSEDIFTINPEITKFIPQIKKKDAATYFAKRGWLLMASSGQLYGLNGSVVLAEKWHEEKIISNHVIRIVPNDKVRRGYLQMAMGHPTLGRPLVTRLAFGMEVPEIPIPDLLDFPVARLGTKVENAIADRVEKASQYRMEADELENDAVKQVEKFLGSRIGIDAGALALPSSHGRA
jgi:type I restriction enzyme, S subunit